MAGMSEYEAEWKEYRHLRQNLILVWMLYVPCVGLFALLCNLLFHSLGPAFAFALLWMIWFVVAGARLEQFKCPRCGNRFDKGPGFFAVRTWIFARKCPHCGLKKFA